MKAIVVLAKVRNDKSLDQTTVGIEKMRKVLGIHRKENWL